MKDMEQQLCREGESALYRGSRRDRFFRVEEQGWFFTTRENSTHGPFASRYEAQQELLMYLRGAYLRRRAAPGGQYRARRGAGRMQRA